MLYNGLFVCASGAWLFVMGTNVPEPFLVSGPAVGPWRYIVCRAASVESTVPSISRIKMSRFGVRGLPRRLNYGSMGGAVRRKGVASRVEICNPFVMHVGIAGQETGDGATCWSFSGSLIAMAIRT